MGGKLARVQVFPNRIPKSGDTDSQGYIRKPSKPISILAS